MNSGRLLWKLYPSFLLVVVLSLLAIGGYSTYTVHVFQLARMRANLEIRAHLLKRSLPATFPRTAADSLQTLCRVFSRDALARVTMLSAAGRVLADSETPPGTETLVFLTEIRDALAGKTGSAIRYHATLKSDVLFVAIPVRVDGQTAGIVRLAVPLTTLTSELRALNLRILLSGVVVALLAALVTYGISRWISRPIAEMKKGAERLAAGNFSQRVVVPRSDEMGGLATALNEMAQQLDVTIRTITAQRNEQEAILTSLREAVIALDDHERVLFVNRAAEELLGLERERVKGRLLAEVVRAGGLQRFIARFVRGQPEMQETELTIYAGEPRILQVTATALHDSAGVPVGVVVVLNDITQLRKLETLRKDFVANVSHELKTPITSITGFVETLREGALNDPESAPSFLNRIAQNTARLNAIIDDLLSLSRIEQESESGAISLEDDRIRRIAQSAIQSCSTKAAERGIGIGLMCRDDPVTRVNSTLLEQALGNLLDNAIKYSEPGRIVDVEIAREGDEIAIHVRDRGSGIPAEHLPRLFERFYRVDKARSRRLGGTGLGLSIVKHIVQAHGGRVGIESEVGVGSVFSIYLPIRASGNEDV